MPDGYTIVAMGRHLRIPDFMEFIAFRSELHGAAGRGASTEAAAKRNLGTLPDKGFRQPFMGAQDQPVIFLFHQKNRAFRFQGNPGQRG